MGKYCSGDSVYEGERLSLDINMNTKYVYLRNIHATRMKKPRKSCFANVMKIRVCERGVKYLASP